MLFKLFLFFDHILNKFCFPIFLKVNSIFLILNHEGKSSFFSMSVLNSFQVMGVGETKTPHLNRTFYLPNSQILWIHKSWNFPLYFVLSHVSHFFFLFIFSLNPGNLYDQNSLGIQFSSNII